MSIKYSSEEIDSWLKSIYPTFEKLKWHTDKVFHPLHIKHYSFFKEDIRYNAKINPTKIHGIQYAYQYNDPLHDPNKRIDWLDLLHNLKRLDSIIDGMKTRESVVDHIHNCKESKVVLQFGNHYFTTAGQHRLCLAKFLEVSEVEVEIIKYKFDRSAFIENKVKSIKSKKHSWLQKIFAAFR